MLTREGLSFILRITDYFHGHWEDPGWGQRPVNQVLLLTALQSMTGGVADAAVRRSLQATLDRATAESAQSLQSKAAA